MNNTLLLSIIVPVYNVEKYIEKCISSLFVPNHNDYEIIIINDGTKDKSIDIVKEKFNDPRVRIIEQENAGLSAARNHGIKESQGAYIWCVDSDDWVETEEIHGILSELKKAADIDLLYFNKYFRNFEISGKETLIELNNKAETGKSLACKNFSHCAPYYIIRKQILMDNHLEFKVGILHEDSLFTPKMIPLCNQVLCYAPPVYHYRQREGTITHSVVSSKRLCDLMGVIKELIDYGNTTIQHDIKYKWGRCIAQITNELLYLSQQCDDKKTLVNVRSFLNRNWSVLKYLYHGGRNNKTMSVLGYLSFGNLYGVYSLLHKIRY